MRRPLLALTLALVAGATTTAPVFACQCARGNLPESLDQVDAAIVGWAIAEPEHYGEDTGIWIRTLHIEHNVKGDLGTEVEVWSSRSETSCGLNPSKDERLGLLLWKTGSRWWSNGCHLADPDVLLEITKPTPLHQRALDAISRDRILGAGTIGMLTTVAVLVAIRRPDEPLETG